MERVKIITFLLAIGFVSILFSQSKNDNVINSNFVNLDTLLVSDLQIKKSKKLGNLKELQIAVIIKYNDCWTCIESIIQDVLRYKIELNLDKSNFAIIVDEGNDEFLKFLRNRYGLNFYFYTANLHKIPTPSVFFRESQQLVTVQPFVEHILSFSKLIDMLIFKKLK